MVLCMMALERGDFLGFFSVYACFFLCEGSYFSYRMALIATC